jgi:hypothetical protein
MYLMNFGSCSSHGFPKTDRPFVFKLNQRRHSVSSAVKQRIAYLCHQMPCHTLSPILGCYGKTIDVAAPSVPSAYHRTDDSTVDYRYQKSRVRCLCQTG